LTIVVFVAQTLLVTGVGVALTAAAHYLSGIEIVNGRALLEQLVANRFYQLVILFLFIINSRGLLFRMDDKEVQS
jgi:hypothetical protein